MSKRVRKPKKKYPYTLIQTTLRPNLARRFFACPEFQLHETIGGALRAILDAHLPQLERESQEKNEKGPAHSIAG